VSPWTRAKKAIPAAERCPSCGWRHGRLTMTTDLLTWRGEACGDWERAQAAAKAERKAARDAQTQANRDARQAKAAAWQAKGGRRSPLGPYRTRTRTGGAQ
jgi:hypothetical protein